MVKINDVAVTTRGSISYSRNRLEQADFGAFKVVNTIEARYEPYSRVLINSEQYLIESDNPVLLKDGNWEHEITLIENIAIFTTVFPVDRQFTTETKTIKEILNTYKRELAYYQDFSFDFDDTDTIYNETMVNKQYSGYNLAVIIYDLFRKINAIPRVNLVDDKWYLTYELYTARNNEITLTVNGKQSSVNDIDYATKVLNKAKNVISEDNGVWFPNKDCYVTPRSKSTMEQTSDWQYELDSNISTILQAIVEVPCSYLYTGTEGLTDGTVTLYVDITNGIRLEDDYAKLKISTVISGNPRENIEITESPSYKQNNIYYNTGSNTIEGLYWKKQSVIIGQNNVIAINNLVLAYLEATAQAHFPSGDDNYMLGTAEPISSNPEDFKCKFYYRAERDIDYITEKQNITGFNSAMITNNQKDSSVEISRSLENSSAFVNRIGNEIKNVREVKLIADKWVLGDYVILSGEYWLITNVKYVLDRGYIDCTADFTKNFSNVNRETGITREPSAFVYNGKSLVSNFVFSEYLVLYKGLLENVEDTILTDLSKRVAMNLFDYSDTYNKPLTNGNYLRIGDNKSIDMPIFSDGGGNTMLFHMQFRDPRVGGYGLRKDGYAWYKDPVYYGDDDYEVDKATIILSNEIDLMEDTNTNKFYPQVNNINEDYTESKVFPFDKDPNDILAFTYQIVIVALNKDIIVPNGFSRFNNLIRYYDTTPTIKIYSDTEPFTIFDKNVRGTEISGSITLANGTITVLDGSAQPMLYWCIGYNGETILAGNNNLSIVRYKFLSDRPDYNTTDLLIYDIAMNNYFSLSIEASKYLTIMQAIFDSDFTLEATYRLLDIFKFNAQFGNEFNLDLTYKLLEMFKVNADFNNEFALDTTYKLLDVFKFNAQFDNEFSLGITYESGYYRITYHEDGADTNNNPATFKESDIPLTLNEPTKSGYTFDGWYPDEFFAGDRIYQILAVGNIYLYAKWI